MYDLSSTSERNLLVISHLVASEEIVVHDPIDATTSVSVILSVPAEFNPVVASDPVDSNSVSYLMQLTLIQLTLTLVPSCMSVLVDSGLRSLSLILSYILIRFYRFQTGNVLLQCVSGRSLDSTNLPVMMHFSMFASVCRRQGRLPKKQHWTE